MPTVPSANGMLECVSSCAYTARRHASDLMQHAWHHYSYALSFSCSSTALELSTNCRHYCKAIKEQVFFLFSAAQRVKAAPTTPYISSVDSTSSRVTFSRGGGGQQQARQIMCYNIVTILAEPSHAFETDATNSLHLMLQKKHTDPPALF